MTQVEVRKLTHGDIVHWTDPDDGACSRTYRIKNVRCDGAATAFSRTIFGEALSKWDTIVTIEDFDGDVTEVFPCEIEKVSNN